MKGLEFDAVIVPDFDTAFSSDPEIQRNQAYCAITRTSGAFYGFYKNEFGRIFNPLRNHEDIINWG